MTSDFTKDITALQNAIKLALKRAGGKTVRRNRLSEY